MGLGVSASSPTAYVSELVFLAPSSSFDLTIADVHAMVEEGEIAEPQGIREKGGTRTTRKHPKLSASRANPLFKLR